MPTVTTTITELPESRVRVHAEVPADEVERRLQQAARKLGAELRIPGFRKGKVPPPVVIRRLGREYVLDEAMRTALGAWYVDAIDNSGIVPIGEPDLDVGDLPAQGEPLQFSIEIGVRPGAQLGEYMGLEVGRREPQVEDAKIDEAVEALRDRMAKLDTVERPAQKGDHIVADYVGKLDGEPFEGGSARDQLIELGSGALIPGFEDQLEGIAAGEERTITVTVPEQYAEELAGREATFDVTVHEVKAKNLPELDDDFASEASEFDTLAELRDDVAAKMREGEESAIEREFEEAVLQAAADNATVDVPAALVHARAHDMVEQSFAALARQGITREMYLQIAGKSEHELAEEAEPEAAQTLRREAVLAAIVEAEGVEPSDEDLIEALRPAAERDGSDPAEVVETLRASERLDQLRDDVAARQALERVVASAKPISVSAAEAREALWTPDKGDPADSGESGAAGAEGSQAGTGKLWTPGS
jgi:trigger factor